MNWYFSVFSGPQGKETLLFASAVRSQKDADDLANTAIEMRPDCVAFVRAPTGNVREYRNEGER